MLQGMYGWRHGRCGLFSRRKGSGSLCSGECCLLKWRTCLCVALLGTASLVLGSSLIHEDQMGRVHVQDMCSQFGKIPAWWTKGQLSQWAPVGDPQGGAGCTFPLRATVSHRAAPAPLLTHCALLTGTIHHGYGWGCHACLCILGTFTQDLITVSGALPSSLCQLCLLSCRADLSLGFVAKGLLPGVWL